MAPNGWQLRLLLNPNAVSVPEAPAVTVWASLRPPGPPKAIDDELDVKPSCSLADTRSVRFFVTTCGSDALSVTCTTKLKVPLVVGAFAKQPFVLSVSPGGKPAPALHVRLPMPLLAEMHRL